jgi:protein phosphatase slingshot
MDPASKIEEFLYLGSEWNASNLEELRQNGITHILNVTREIDNFFPGTFQYMNVRVYDEEITDLLKHFNSTYSFIKTAKASSGKVLVHCKMGISRSASVVISFLMKEHRWALDKTLAKVKKQR